ncbi:MAG TPA: hypothetical protein VGO21_03980, partial [Candidatus Paceibacterota bacterium]|nr:hypothetical protein [Candidatus Paceibacterota bacterium]
KIQWVVPSNFEILLNQPSNFDLGQLYFGQADEFGFIRRGVNPRIQTFLQSNECLNLPLSYNGTTIQSVPKSILRRSQKSFFVIGHPGSGKSIFVHFLFREFSGLAKSTENQMISALVKQGAVPMIINLKDCIDESLEGLIRARQNDSGVRGRSLNFIYLLDGLDELSDEKADQTLSFIKELEQYEQTKKIIISCRSGNSNRIKAVAYLPDIIEYKFCDLDVEFIEQYFTKKEDKIKSKLLKQLQKTNPKLLSDIKDILLIRLLWETIKNIRSDNTVVDLIQKKITLLLNDPEHKKNIDSLNLLDVKPDSLITLNQEISFKFYQKFQYRFSRKELQDIILTSFPRLDYRGTNELLNYLSNLFFENTYSETEQNPEFGFIYQHRRYQEFFFTQRLKIEYENDPHILRTLDVLSNRDFFEEYFLPFLRGDYEKREYVIGLLDLNLLDVYLGKHSGYGVDDAYYLNSSEFIPSLASQNSYLVDELLESQNFHLKKILFIDVEKLIVKFKEWETDPQSYRVGNYLSSIWTEGVSSILKNIVVFWEAGNKDIVNKLITNLREVDKIYRERGYLKKVDTNHRPQDPFWKEWQAYLFLLIHIQRKNINNIFQTLVRKNYELFSEETQQPNNKKEGKEKLIRSFLTV